MHDFYLVGKPSRDPDEHGWALDDVVIDGQVETGNIQEDHSPQTEYQAQGRDKGPAQPHPFRSAAGYLDPDTTAVAGDLLITATTNWRVLSTVLVNDPVQGIAGVVVAQLREVPA